MNALRILVAGVGNLFMADDAFGCEVARRLAQRSLPPQVRVVDFGIRGLDLTYAMLDDYETVILVDAAPRGQSPGTLYVIEPLVDAGENVMLQTHGMDLVKVLQAAAALGGRPRRVLIVGCEPTPRDPDADWEQSLSPPVRAAVDEAVALIESLVMNGGIYDASMHASGAGSAASAS
jgi:hydrogenase maturation protease